MDTETRVLKAMFYFWASCVVLANVLFFGVMLHILLWPPVPR